MLLRRSSCIYGNTSATTNSDPFTPFTHATLTDMHHVVRDDFGGGDTVEVYSLIDGNIVQLDNGATTSLDLGDSISYSTFTATSVVRALGPINSRLDGLANGDSLVPLAFASTSFVVAPRDNSNNDEFHIFSPFGSSTVRIYDAAASIPGYDQAVATTSQDSPIVDIANGDAANIDAELPVLVAYEYGTGDGVTLYPATTRDLYGIDSQRVHTGISVDNTTFDIACSVGAGGSSTAQSKGNRLCRYLGLYSWR